MEIFDDLCLKCSKAERMTFSPGVDEDLSGLAALNASINSLIDQILERNFITVWKSFLITHKEAGPAPGATCSACSLDTEWWPTTGCVSGIHWKQKIRS